MGPVSKTEDTDKMSWTLAYYTPLLYGSFITQSTPKLVKGEDMSPFLSTNTCSLWSSRMGFRRNGASARDNLKVVRGLSWIQGWCNKENWLYSRPPHDRNLAQDPPIWRKIHRSSARRLALAVLTQPRSCENWAQLIHVSDSTTWARARISSRDIRHLLSPGSILQIETSWQKAIEWMAKLIALCGLTERRQKDISW